LSTEIEELTKLVEEEKIAEDKIKQARNNAEEIVKRAREEANKIMLEAQNSLSSKEPPAQRRREFGDEKLKIEQEHQHKISSLKETAEKNFDRAVKMIVEDIMRVES